MLPARAASFFGDSLAFVVLSLRVAEGDRPTTMTVLFIAFSLPLFLLSGVAGRLVDEHDSRRLLVAAGSLQVVASLGLVIAPNMASIVGCVLLLQVGQAVTGPTWAALVPRIVGDALVGRAVGLQQTLSAMAGLAGAAVGGVLYDAAGYRFTMLLDTTTFAVLVLVGASVHTRRGRRYDIATSPDHDGGTQLADHVMSGRQFIVRDPLLRLLAPALLSTVLVTRPPEQTRGRVLAAITGISRGFSVVAMVLGGVAGQYLGARTTFVVCGVLSVAVSGVVLRSRRAVDEPNALVETAGAASRTP